VELPHGPGVRYFVELAEFDERQTFSETDWYLYKYDVAIRFSSRNLSLMMYVLEYCTEVLVQSTKVTVKGRMSYTCCVQRPSLEQCLWGGYVLY
jgi:hypothetical protein